jgi:tetratricopeptide (TPR) repeat protein
MELGRYAEAREKTRAVAAFDRRAHLLWSLVVSLWNIAVADVSLGSLDAVLRGLEEMDELRERLGVDDDEAYYLELGSMALVRLGRTDEALTRAEASVSQARTASTRRAMRRNLAYVQSRSARFDEALRVLETVPDEEPWEHAMSRRIAGYCHAALGDFEAADRELALSEQHAPTPLDRARTRHQLGRLRRRQGRFDEAEKLLRDVLLWFDERQFQFDASIARIEIARCRVARGLEVRPGFLDPVDDYVASEPFESAAAIRRQLARARADAAG